MSSVNLKKIRFKNPDYSIWQQPVIEIDNSQSQPNAGIYSQGDRIIWGSSILVKDSTQTGNWKVISIQDGTIVYVNNLNQHYVYNNNKWILTMLNLSSLTQDSSNLIITDKNLQIKSGSNVSASISTAGLISGSSLTVNTISVKSSSHTNTISYGDITNWNNAKPNQTFTAGTGIKLNGGTSNVSTDTVSISVDGKLTDTTYAAGNGLSLSSNTFSVKLPTDSGLSSSSAGLILGTPGTISSTSSNTKSGITHSHELGMISVTKGGTGTGSFTLGNYLIGSGTNALTQKTPANVWIDVAGNSGTVSIAKGGTAKGSFSANQIIYGNNLTQSADLIYSSSKLGLTTNTTNLGKDDSVLQVGGNSKLDGSLKFGKLSSSISNFQITWNENVNTIDFNFFI